MFFGNNKQIRFKNTIIDTYANKAALTVIIQTTGYLSPGIQPNPSELRSRQLAYTDKKLSPTRKGFGGGEGEGVQNNTATVLYAAKSLKKGLRELGESLASSLTATGTSKPGTSPNSLSQ